MREILNKEFQQDKHKRFRQWYFNKYSTEELKSFKDKYYEDLERTEDYISFVQWFIKYYINTIKNEILVLQSKNWKTVRGETINSEFPPEQIISLDPLTEAAPYISNVQKIESAQVTIKEINAIVKSQNYTNSFLNCVGNQFAHRDQELTFLHVRMEKQMTQQQIIVDQLKQITEAKQVESSMPVPTRVL